MKKRSKGSAAICRSRRSTFTLTTAGATRAAAVTIAVWRERTRAWAWTRGPAGPSAAAAPTMRSGRMGEFYHTLDVPGARAYITRSTGDRPTPNARCPISVLAVLSCVTSEGAVNAPSSPVDRVACRPCRPCRPCHCDPACRGSRTEEAGRDAGRHGDRGGLAQQLQVPESRARRGRRAGGGGRGGSRPTEHLLRRRRGWRRLENDRRR